MSRMGWEGGLQSSDRQTGRKSRDSPGYREPGEGAHRKQSCEIAEKCLDGGKDGEEGGRGEETVVEVELGSLG